MTHLVYVVHLGVYRWAREPEPKISFEITDRVAQPTLARITGGLYLMFIVASVVANAVGHIGLGNAQQVYGSLTTSPGSFRLGLATAFLSAFLFLMAAWGLYVLLRTVNKDLALLFLLLNTVGVAIQCASMLQLVSAMLIGDPAGGLASVQPAQAETLALLAIDVYRTGFVTALLFLGTWLFPLGHLVLKSGFLGAMASRATWGRVGRRHRVSWLPASASVGPSRQLAVEVDQLPQVSEYQSAPAAPPNG